MQMCEETPATEDTPDAEMQAFDRVNDILRDEYGFTAIQIHVVHEAIRRAGMDLTLRQD